MMETYDAIAIEIVGTLTDDEYAKLVTIVESIARFANPDVTVKLIGINGIVPARLHRMGDE